MTLFDGTLKKPPLGALCLKEPVRCSGTLPKRNQKAALADRGVLTKSLDLLWDKGCCGNMSVPEITDLLSACHVWRKCQCPEGQVNWWKTVYGSCRHLCTSYLHVYGGAPGQFPCHPGDEEKDKVLISTSFHG